MGLFEASTISYSPTVAGRMVKPSDLARVSEMRLNMAPVSKTPRTGGEGETSGGLEDDVTVQGRLKSRWEEIPFIGAPSPIWRVANASVALDAIFSGKARSVSQS